MPVMNGDTDVLGGEITLSNLISPVGSSDMSENKSSPRYYVDETVDQLDRPEMTTVEAAKSSSSPTSTRTNHSLNDMLNQLTANYESTVDKVNETFESMRFALDNRRTYLLNELKLFYEEKRALVSIQPNEELLLEKFDLETVSNSSGIAELLKKTSSLDTDFLNSIINNYGKIVRLKSNSDLFDCSIEGSLPF